MLLVLGIGRRRLFRYRLRPSSEPTKVRRPADVQLRLLNRGEVPAPVELRPVGDRGVVTLGELPDREPRVLAEDRDADRDGDWLRRHRE